MVSIGEEFERRTDPFRRELLVHCYQMLGSIHDAEDLLQETMLRAWRAYGRFDEGRASLRTWLYRIATNACLTARAVRSRRPLPSGFSPASDDPERPLVPGQDVPWLQPFPDALLGSDRGDPADVLAARGSLRLALVAAWQLLPPRQRAILILREVLDFSAAEVAAMLETTPAAVNSALQRARARLGTAGLREEQVAEPSDPDVQALVERYVAAIEHADIATLQHLLTEDALLEMPPMLNWFTGREAYGRFMATIFATLGTDWRMLRTGANGQLALAAYVRGRDGSYQARTIQVLTVISAGISRNVVFQDPTLFPLFDLPATLDATGSTAGSARP